MADVPRINSKSKPLGHIMRPRTLAMRGRRAKQADEEAQAEGDAVEVIDVSAHQPRRIPSKKVARVDQEVWEADPLRCPKCSREPNEVR